MKLNTYHLAEHPSLLRPALLLALSACAIDQSHADQLFTSNATPTAQTIKAPRQLNYWPVNDGFVCVNGSNRFTRALYGSNTGFRLETSDYPEFAFYMPQMGGNLLFESLSSPQATFRIEEAADMVCTYRPGTREYVFTVPESMRIAAHKEASLHITALALYSAEGAIWKVESHNVKPGMVLTLRYGGATNQRFSREGDLGVDKKDCFDFKEENCKNNIYSIQGTQFTVQYGKDSKRGEKQLQGYVDSNIALRDVKLPHIAPSASYLQLELTIPSARRGSSVSYFMMGDKKGMDQLQAQYHTIGHTQLQTLFQNCEQQIVSIAHTIQIDTPDPFFNTLGGTMSMAADAIWGEDSVWLHGSIGWRMPLPGWRAAYTGDVMGWHDRARTHFNNYAASQLVDVPVTLPNERFDTAKNLARSLEKIGTPMYSTGYICRYPRNTKKVNHYDMNLVYMDELLWHLNWTGDWDYAYQIWPTIDRHLQWEKRNFDPNDDGLYDAYCCIWASDALSYNGGAVTHSSAYNYRANKMAAMIAHHFATDPACIQRGEAQQFAQAEARYEAEARKILQAINQRLWMPGKGVWAEYQDAIGHKRLHEQPALWTIYHALDSDIATPAQATTALNYVTTQIPHIAVLTTPAHEDSRYGHIPSPLKAYYDRAMTDLQSHSYHVVSTTNWQPYMWSINNVALAEIAHTALAYWQAGQSDEGFTLLKSALLDAMYLGKSPGNFVQISHYDAARSECYRDFGDPVGITCRTLIQGLFGVRPDRLNRTVRLVPGFPSHWDHASIQTPDYRYEYKYNPKQFTTLTYQPARSFQSDTLCFELAARCTDVASVDVRIDGKKTQAFEVVKTYGEDASQAALSKILVKVYTPQQSVDGGKGVASGTQKTAATSRLQAATPSVELCVRWQGNALMQKALEPQYTTPKEAPTMAYFEEVDTTRLRPVDLTAYYNDNVTDMFHHDYLSPRYPYTTLSVPKHGYGEWCVPLDSFVVDDSYIRESARQHGAVRTGTGVAFQSPATGPNIALTSIWDNFPNQITIPLSGHAQHIYLMMAGTTHPMQSRIANGVIRIRYANGECDSLQLVNPETWWPIDRDYVADMDAYYLTQPAPYRQLLSAPQTYRPHHSDVTRKIPGGAAMLLDLPVRAHLPLQSLELEVLSNEILMGIMGITLQDSTN